MTLKIFTEAEKVVRKTMVELLGQYREEMKTESDEEIAGYFADHIVTDLYLEGMLVDLGED